MKKIVATIFCVIAIASCGQKTDSKQLPKKEAISKQKNANKNAFYKSDLRPNENLEADKIYQDEVVFSSLDLDGDFPVVLVKKNGKEIWFLVSDANPEDYYAEKLPFCEGDIVTIQWKLEKFSPGNGEVPYFKEFLYSSKKSKDGKLSIFNKKHPEKLELNEKDENFSDAELKKIDDKVRYYLANTNKDIFAEVEEPPLMYSATKKNIDNKNYIEIEFCYLYQGQLAHLEMFYIDQEINTIYNYDNRTKKLIKFN